MAPGEAAAKGKSKAKAAGKTKKKAAVFASESDSGNFEADESGGFEGSVGGETATENFGIPEISVTMPVKAKSKSKAAASKSKAKAAPARTYVEYYGPRPDEELLSAVTSELKAGDDANVEWIYELLRSGEDINQRSELGVTSLAVAAAGGNGPLVSLLLERRADVSMLTIHKSELALHHAARNGNRVVCQLLVEPTEAAGLVNWPNVLGWPPLHVACAAGHAQALNVLLRHGGDINVRNELVGGSTALQMAIRAGSADAAEILMDKDADVDTVNCTGRSALHIAAGIASPSCVSLLLRKRADPMRKGNDGLTPLDCVPADGKGRDKVVSLLQAYMRPPPERMRSDARFDKLDARDVYPNVLKFIEDSTISVPTFKLPFLADDSDVEL